jgi:hypothetical protein
MTVYTAKTFGKWGRRQSYDLDMGIVLDKLIHTPSRDVALVYDKKIDIGKGLAPLKSLSRADLNPLMGTIPPMGRLHDPVIDSILV